MIINHQLKKVALKLGPLLAFQLQT